MINRTIRYVAGWGALALGLLGTFAKNETLEYIGFIVLGTITLVYRRDISTDIMKLYPVTSKRYIRWGVPIMGISFLVFGAAALLGTLSGHI
jgi:hypothetical protein